MAENGYEENKVKGNGFCILAAVQRALLFDHSYLSSIARIQERVLEHLIRRGDLYDGFHKGTPASLATEAANFYEDRNFNRRLVDILVLAVADALSLRIKIVRESPEGNIQFLIMEGQNPQMEILLKFGSHVDPNNPDYVGANHYDAITKKNELAELALQLEKQIEEEEPSTFTPPTNAIRSSTEPEREENPDYGSDAIRTPDLTREFDDFVTPETVESNELNPEASIGDMLSDIFIGTPANENSDAIRNQQVEEFAEDMFTGSADAIRNREPHVLQLDKDFEKSILEMHLRPNTVFPVHLFSRCTPKKVQFLPPNIDGLKVYRVSCTAKDIVKKTTDRRWFYMRTTSKSGFRGIRKVGTCMGSWSCQNPECSFLKTEKTRNTTHFEYKAGSRACYSCGQFAAQAPCGARKLIQHSFGSDHADVYHFGYHECELKQEVANDRDYTKEWVKKYPGLSFRDLKTTVIQTFLDDHNTLGAKMAAERITYRAYRSCKHTLRLESDSAEVSTQSIEAVVELKKGSDEIDKYYIYEVNNSAMNNLPDYVIKSSSTVLRFAIQMDQSGPQNILQDEDCYFDGSYSRCKDFVSLGLWLRHPSMRRIVKLAGMETKKEDTVSITIFFKKFNEMLQRITQKEDYMFNPKNIMMDEAGANFAGVTNVFGQKFVDEKCITCQWHFLTNMHEHKHEIEEKFRDEFLNLAQQLCTRKTVPEFDLIYAEMVEIVEKSPDAGGFLEWHYVRRIRTFPAFREALHSGANIAEIGNAQWKPEHRLALVVAGRNDINRMIQFEADYRKFQSGESFHRGQAPTDVQRATAERRFQIEQGRAFADVLRNTAAQEMQMELMANPPRFRPGQNSKHKPKKKGKGVQGNVPVNVSRRPQTLSLLLERLTKAKGLATTPQQEAVPQVFSEESLLGRGPVPRQIRPLPNEKLFVVKHPSGVSVCQGCPTKIHRKDEPHNLIYRLRAIRPYKELRTQIWVDRIANIYFHFNFDCVKKVASNLKVEDVRIALDDYAALSDAHLMVLAQCGLLEGLIKIVEAELQVILDNVFNYLYTF